MIPTLTTERLRLRPLREGDLDAFVAFYASPASAFYGGACDRADAWRRMASYAGSWVLKGFGPFAVESRAAGEFLGMVGPWAPEGWPEPEITWMLLSRAQGKGYATEAAGAALDFAYRRLGWPTAVSAINPDNTPSLRLAERLGACFAYETVIRGGEGVHVYRHRAPQTRRAGGMQ